MRVKSISLSWFRGAGGHTILNTDLKNVVVYGANGSGKSSFSDAIEYVVTRGKIRHLMHEYSGSKQEKGVINTHAPPGLGAAICITFEGDISIDSRLAPDGTPSFSSNPEDLVGFIQTWELERLILRQDEVAAFIEKTKGVKYSVLLPLLGLEHLEQAAENINKLCRSIEEEGELSAKITRLDILKQEANKHFPDLSEKTVLNVLKNIAKSYIKDKIPTKLQALADVLTETIKQRIDLLTPEITRHVLVTKICEEDLLTKLGAMIKADEKIMGKVDALLDSHIEILQEASKYIDKLDSDKKEIKCPACGRTIGTDEFGEHVRRELQSLKDICLARDSAIETRRVIKNSIRQVLVYAEDGSISSWLSHKNQKELKEALTELAGIDKKEWHDAYSSDDKAKLCKIIPVIVNHIKVAVDAVPPSSQKLLDDSKVVEASKSITSISVLAKQITAIRVIVQALDTSESQIRNSIKSRTKMLIQTVSVDIQTLWSRIHPGEPIEDVKLYIPEDADKSIEIGLKFHGQEQPSPRLTLSEGHRNSLGLCIFWHLLVLEVTSNALSS